ncbi:glycosyltransferase family 2 protein [Paenibacillus sp. IHBB 3054]|uniref:glycosyltransferase family 2 protein n=1 Tax=Paenibacillus sp. IHBB 3054 TaxID=3425689 RepID=UPI003F67E1F2
MKVSLITVSYNSEKTIKDTISSVLFQSYKNIEYIIIDGNSKDGTVNIVKEYEPQFNGRLKWISETDKGLYDAMNKGIKLASGDIIGIINSDDMYTDEYVIEKVVKKMNIDNAEILYANLQFVDEYNTEKIVRKWIPGYGSFNLGWNPPHPTTFVRKNIYEHIGLYKSEYKISSDYDFLFRSIQANKVRTSYLNEFIVNMRMGGASTSGIKSTIQGSKEVYNTLKENKVNFPLGIVCLRLLRKLKQVI